MTKILISSKANIRIDKKCCLENKDRASLPGYNKCTCSNCGNEYLKYYSAKTEKCCSCREKLRLVKHGAAVILHAGFPKKEVFKTYHEINEYFSGDEITCLLCGNGYTTLPAHLGSIHGISADAYKEMFGLPLSRGLVSDSHHEKISNSSKDRCIGRDIESMREMRNKIKHDLIRPINKVIKKHCNDRLSDGVKNTKNHVTKRINLIDANCSNCGEELERKVTEYAVLAQGCNILCKSCQDIKYKESQIRYSVKRKNKEIS